MGAVTEVSHDRPSDAVTERLDAQERSARDLDLAIEGGGGRRPSASSEGKATPTPSSWTSSRARNGATPVHLHYRVREGCDDNGRIDEAISSPILIDGEQAAITHVPQISLTKRSPLPQRSLWDPVSLKVRERLIDFPPGRTKTVSAVGQRRPALVREEALINKQDWNHLLGLIQERRVVPIVGEELLTVRYQGRDRPLYLLLAEKLAERLGVRGARNRLDFNTVASRFLENGGDKLQIYTALQQIMPSDDELQIPKPLLQLAEISDFELFVSTTFDSLMQRALHKTAPGNQPTGVEVISWAPDDPHDLADSAPRPGRILFQLLGRLSATPVYSVTHEDMLEFLHGLQRIDKQPAKLITRLKSDNLLILGSSLGLWLARFLLRAARDQKLSIVESSTFVADTRILYDANQVTFFERFARHVTIFQHGGPAEFVQTLYKRWKAEQPEPTKLRAVTKNLKTTEFQPGAVFLSYRRYDEEAARQIKVDLESEGVEVFFDKTSLRAGDHWEAKLSKAIKNSSSFIPVISKSIKIITFEAYVFEEWDLALRSAKRRPPNRPFILPVSIDETEQDAEDVPEGFKVYHWTSLPGGKVTPQFLERIKELYQVYHRATDASAS